MKRDMDLRAIWYTYTRLKIKNINASNTRLKIKNINVSSL